MTRPTERTMDRRPVLVGLGSSLASVAGCLGTVRRSSRETIVRDVSIELEGPDPSLDVELTVRNVRPFTGEDPATFEIAMTNEAEVERQLGAGSLPPFRESLANRGKTDDSLISVSTGDSTVPDRPDGDGCWRARERFASNDELPLRDFDPGEARTATHALLAPKHADSCYPPGIYRFETTVQVTETGESSDAAFVVTLK